MQAIHVSMAESVLSGTHGTNVTVHTLHSAAGTVEEVCFRLTLIVLVHRNCIVSFSP